jgi:hypothetical protein
VLRDFCCESLFIALALAAINVQVLIGIASVLWRVPCIEYILYPSSMEQS